MRLLTAFRELPVSLFIASLALASRAQPVYSTELTPDTFKSSISNGLWFIEYFSPYCGHCREFASTWDQLVDESEKDHPTVKLAQVNCIASGDLCNENDVKAYPTLRIYNNGERIENFKGYRTLDKLHDFIKRHADAASPPPPPPPPPAADPEPLPQGDVLSLTSSSFATNLAKGPMFVKFFAPWCGHCKKLAPVWKQLANHMQDKLTVAEVNCDDNSSLCKANNVQGYPTLVYLTADGLKSEYNGGRKLEQLKAFAEKASTAGVQAVKTEELDNVVKKNDVVYLLLHAQSDTSIVDTVKRAASPLLGTPILITASDHSLFTRFSIPQTSTWALLSFKDRDPTAPSSIHHERISTPSTLSTWLLTHRLPTALELTQDTFQGVMNAPQTPLVVIAAVGERTKVPVSTRLHEIGKEWRLRTGGSGLVGGNGREVVFTWMDGEKWKEWMKSMYGIVHVDGPSWDDVRVVITDHKRLVYYDTDTTDASIKLSSSTALFEAIEAAAAGSLPYKHSENGVERLARYLNEKMASLEHYVMTHLWRTAFFGIMTVGLVIMALKRLVTDDLPGGGEYHKVDRLD